MGVDMTNKQEIVKLNEFSPSVQTHLSIIQSVIQRMATNSTSSKTWCITIVSAILVIVADKGKPDYAWIALIPTTLFMALDAYYLALEKGFRQAYNAFIRKIHDGSITPEDLFSVAPEGRQSSHQIEALKSFSVWGFYLTLIILIVIAKSIVIGMGLTPR
jgi:hypothetical protein